MKFKIDKAVFEKFPNLVVAVPIILGFDNTKAQKEALEFLRDTEKNLKNSTTLEKFWQDKKITSYLNCFKAFGSDPEKFRPAHVALSIRVLEGGQLPDINPLVNFYNAMSLKYTTPFGGENFDALYGDFILKFAEGGEQWIPIGGNKSKPAVKGELIWQDAFDLSTRALNWRQCDRTKMTPEVKNGYFVMDGFSDINKDVIEKAAGEFVESVEKLFGGKGKIYWLDKNNPEFEIDFKSKDIDEIKKIEKVEKKQSAVYSQNSIVFTLQKSLYEAIKLAYPDLSINQEEIILDHPTVEEFGDYSTNIAKRSHLDPEKIIANFNLAGVTPANLNGFVNFKLPQEFLIEEMQKVDENYGKNDSLKNKKIMVEFAHPNTHKQFHIGHLRNITLGEHFCRLFAFCGAQVSRTNYQGDVGMHVAKALYGVLHLNDKCEEAKLKDTRGRVAFLGEAYILGSKEFEENELAKQEIVALNKKIYSKDPEIMGIYQETRQWSLDYFELIYERVYTKFDRLYFEGEVAGRGKELVLANVGKIFEESDGAIIFRGTSHTRVFINSEGNPTYEGKDMGLGELQFKEYNPDLLIHNLGPEQLSYTSVMFEALAKLFPETAGREMHLPYGWVKLKEGKMSSRMGNVVLGEWLLDEIKKKISDKYPDRISDVEPIAVAAAKYSMLKVGREQEIAFDIDESITLDGDSGPYIQYTYARAKSVLRKSGTVGAIHESPVQGEEMALLRHLYKFPEVVELAAKQYAPNVICTYLFELAKRFNNFYNNCPIIGNDFRIKTTAATAQILENGLNLLGIKALEKM